MLCSYAIREHILFGFGFSKILSVPGFQLLSSRTAVAFLAGTV